MQGLWTLFENEASSKKAVISFNEIQIFFPEIEWIIEISEQFVSNLT